MVLPLSSLQCRNYITIQLKFKIVHDSNNDSYLISPRYRNGRVSRGEHRPRAYSDSDAENYQESAHNSHPFRLPPPFKHRFLLYFGDFVKWAHLQHHLPAVKFNKRRMENE